MTEKKASTEKYIVPFRALIPFLLITFVLTWSILALFIFLPEQMTRYVGALSGEHPLFFLAVWAPAIAAVLLILSKAGPQGLTRFLSRLSLWRAGVMWYVFLLVGIPAIFYLGAAWKGTISDPLPFATASSVVTALLLGLIKGPLEELGWRGFALPLLQRRLSAFWSALLLGIIWGIWHLPAFLASGTQQSGWSFLPFFIGTIAISVIITALFNATRGSLLLAAFMHFQLMNPIWPDAQPYDTYVLSVVALVLVWAKRKEMFTRARGVQEVVPGVER